MCTIVVIYFQFALPYYIEPKIYIKNNCLIFLLYQTPTDFLINSIIMGFGCSSTEVNAG